ncbi:hypothetical protein [Nocardioides perillae]|uniref:DUF1772 domain-containing protein n=1 Tax=Nocardioides perillae TaxID=1119534 RepID=A0A7Y9RU83_9ACTN|nr:hypothetical protein [Nocardioides perillae]
MDPEVALLAATALHAGFQATVTRVVYPALADVDVDRWRPAHEAHSRRISLVVLVVYAALVAACCWVLVDGPRTPAAYTALTGAALAGLTTAAVAAPTHGALGRGPTDALVRRLLVADRVRLLGAVVALGGATVLVTG